MTTSKKSLLDTNVLVYAADTSSPFHERSRALRDKGIAGELSLCVSPQILSEFFAVVTDSRRVADPRTQEEALTEIKKYVHAKNLLKIYPGAEMLETMLNLLRRYPIRRQEIFDLQLVATMLANGIALIYTFNLDHFSKFKEIEAVEP